MSLVPNTCKLPAIEVYSIAGVPDKHEDFIEWVNKSWHWWHSLNFNFFRGDFYGNEALLFTWHDFDRNGSLPPANRLVILPEKFFEIKEKSSQKKQIPIISLDLIDFSINVVEAIIFVEFLIDAFQFLEKRRRIVFDAIKGRPKVYSGLSKYINLHQEFQNFVMIFKRFSLEFEQAERYIEQALGYVDDLLEIDVHKSRKRNEAERISLHKNIISRINYSKQILLGQIDFIEKTFSTRIEFLNINAMYRLQKITIWLTIIATVLALIGILANVDQFMKSLDYLSSLLR